MPQLSAVFSVIANRRVVIVIPFFGMQLPLKVQFEHGVLVAKCQTGFSHSLREWLYLALGA